MAIVNCCSQLRHLTCRTLACRPHPSNAAIATPAKKRMTVEGKFILNRRAVTWALEIPAYSSVRIDKHATVSPDRDLFLAWVNRKIMN